METIRYTGDLWQGETIHPDLWRLLVQRDLLVEIGEPEPAGTTSGTRPFVLGVPHHGAPGEEQIAESWLNPLTGAYGRPADESSALPGLALYQALRDLGRAARLVIACHASDHDPNKNLNSPYWRAVMAGLPPALLFELHGAASHRRHDLELSAGMNTVTGMEDTGRLLGFNAPDWLLAVQREPGSRDAALYKNHQQSGGRLQNPALRTESLAEAGRYGIPALHLEMKFLFRRPDPAFREAPRPNPQAWKLARALAQTLDALHPPAPIRIAAADLGLESTALLIRPTLDYDDSFWAAVQEAPQQDIDVNPDLRFWFFEQARSLILAYRDVQYQGLPNEPPEECLWLMDQGEFIGRVILFHWLNAYHRTVDGQVDYWIRPSKRRQGYGHVILRLALERFKQLRVKRILISCLAGNLASQRIIEAAGGVYEGEIEEQDDTRRRYWIAIGANRP